MIENKNNINDAPLSRETNKVHYLKNFGQSTQEDNRYILMHTVLFDMNYGTFNNCTVVENSLPSTIPTKITENGSIKLHVVPNTGYKLTNDCFTITNATYNYADGYLTISNPTGDVSVSADAQDDYDYFCITLVTAPTTNEGLTISIEIYTASGFSQNIQLECSYDKKTWENISSITLDNVGDKVYIRGNNSYLYSSGNYMYFKTSSQTARVSLNGDMTTLISKQGNVLDLTDYNSYLFKNIFLGAQDSDKTFTIISDAKNLKLPSAKLSNGCYQNLFKNQTYLSTSPTISALSLATYSCSSMFYDCTSLTTPPALPATTLADYCYQYMFYGCTNLTTPPALPATTLAKSCYYMMFYNCTGLLSTNTISAIILARSSCNYMFENCTSLLTFNNFNATTLAEYCCQHMFYGCTSLSNIPITLPATTLAAQCYEEMFKGCISLTTTPTLPATTLAKYCYNEMFSGCTSLTTSPALPATTLADYCYEYMFKNCTNLTTAPALPATTLTDYCYWLMFCGCTSLTTAPALPATTLTIACYNQMFTGCTSLTAAPSLPATTLAQSCYFNMFCNCTSLNTIPKLPATTLNNYCYKQMFKGCTNIKMSTSYTGEYINAYTFGVTPSNSYAQNMFTDTGGSFTGTPTQQIYYTSNTIIE